MFNPQLFISEVRGLDLSKEVSTKIGGADTLFKAGSYGQSITWDKTHKNVLTSSYKYFRFVVSDANWKSGSSKEVGYLDFKITDQVAALEKAQLSVDSRSTGSFTGTFATVPGECTNLQCVKNSNCHTKSGGSGVDYDVMFLVSYDNCSPASMLGGAVTCGIGEDNRPTVININLCRGPLLAATSAKDIRTLKSLAIHELMHGLGMSSEHFPNFIDRKTGIPYNTDSPKQTIPFQCGRVDTNGQPIVSGNPTDKWTGDGLTNQYSSNFNNNVWKATNVIDFSFTERGVGNKCPLKAPPGTVGMYGECIQKIITPAVKRESRKCKFSCLAVCFSCSHHITLPVHVLL